MAMQRATVQVSGMVQGVGFRYMAQRQARQQRLTGYVQNLDDGSLAVVVEGEEQDLKDFIRWCYNGVGPAIVQKIDTQWSGPTGEFSDFSIIK